MSMFFLYVIVFGIFWYFKSILNTTQNDDNSDLFQMSNYKLFFDTHNFVISDLFQITTINTYYDGISDLFQIPHIFLMLFQIFFKYQIITKKILFGAIRGLRRGPGGSIEAEIPRTEPKRKRVTKIDQPNDDKLRAKSQEDREPK